MPRDLFGDVTSPSISVGNRKWYTVPVSLISHALVIAAIVIVPILAAPMMPGVLDNSTVYRFVDLVPPKPPAPPPKPADLKPVENPNAAPTQPPDGIKPEQKFENFEADRPGTGVIGGPEDIDTVLAPPPPIAKPATPPEPVHVGGIVRQPIKIGGNDPVYPAVAQSARIQGIVIIEATLGADGRVMNARVLRSVHMLDQAALDAVRTWQYTPTLLNGVAVPVIMTVTVTFTLSR